jgi:tetratricopeptide (TPR) repeat protein
VARPARRKKILLLASAPQNQQPLRLGVECREIEDRLRKTTLRWQFDLRSRWAVRPRDLQQALLEERPEIVHFSGHGSDCGELYLEDDYGNSRAVSTEALSQLFEILTRHIRFDCVVLNACYAEVQARAIARHVPYVIGMSTAITDESAIQYSVAFYGGLGEGMPVEDAHELARNALDLHGSEEHLIPVLLAGAPPLPPTDSDRLGRLSREEIAADVREYKAALDRGVGMGGAHFGLGHLYLQLRLYDLALKHFRQSVGLEPDFADGYYYVALTMLRGKRPKTLMIQEVRAIEAQLCAALQLDPRPAKYYFLLAAVRSDYYLTNGLTSPSPSSRELLAMAREKEYDFPEVERLLDSITLRDEALVSQIRRQSE